MFKWSLYLLLTGLFTAMLAWAYVLLFQDPAMTLPKLKPIPVAAGDQEIAWLHPATNAPVWERFITGLRVKAEENPEWGLHIDESRAFPEQTADVPMIALKRAKIQGTLWLRWYKITSQQDIDYWVKALFERSPPPLVIVGGGSSDRARDLACAMARESASVADPPLLLITTATANMVTNMTGSRVPLMQIYPGKTFRLCFSNAQMSEAITDFIWQRADLRPMQGQVYLLSYLDDPYSRDLVDQFRKIFLFETTSPSLKQHLQSSSNIWQEEIPYGVGPLLEPNRSEAEIVERFVESAMQRELGQSLLVLAADPKPARRMLRSIFRSAPSLAQHMVVTAGDTIDFDTIYRDRHLAWPIQDLPCRLVLFCHQNPILASVGFLEEQNAPPTATQSSTSTQNALLYGDLAALLIENAHDNGRWVLSPGSLALSMQRAKDWLGRVRFDAQGDRLGGAGEYVVLLEPIRLSDRVYPKALLSVFERNEASDWRLVDRMEVYYGVKLLPLERSAP